MTTSLVRSPLGRLAALACLAVLLISPMKGESRPALDAATRATVAAALKRLAPQAAAPDTIRQGPIAGLLEVRMGGHIVYVSADGRHLVEGSVIDTKTRANLTQGSLNDALAIPWEQLPLKEALVTRRAGAAKRHLAAFADPMCGYCKRFELELQKTDNLVVHTFPLPVLGQRSEDLVRKILCAPDPSGAWVAWMTRAVEPPAIGADTSCQQQANATIERMRAFARTNSITGTPTNFSPRGLRQQGALQGAELEAFLGGQAGGK